MIGANVACKVEVRTVNILTILLHIYKGPNSRGIQTSFTKIY